MLYLNLLHGGGGRRRVQSPLALRHFTTGAAAALANLESPRDRRPASPMEKQQGCDSISLVRALVSPSIAMVLASDTAVLCQMS
ncbi:MAG: hypothetical protein DCF28_00560 [Alphaproteobacteria bacterium]|nr:MAG: hypothetical protein DCF28_00560 [Alphaproteobacteria bacterium]PZO33385.1 MAG: hypothetical protein DCE92_13125 [Alphaproteobacteria bacterium]